MEHPLKRSPSRVRQVNLAGAFERHARRNACYARFDRIQLQLCVGPGAKHDLAMDRGLGLGELEFSLPLSEEIPRVIHGTDVRYLHGRMSRHQRLLPK